MKRITASFKRHFSMQGFPEKAGPSSSTNDKFPGVKRSLSTSQQPGPPIPSSSTGPSLKVPRVDASVAPSPFSASRKTLEQRISMETSRSYHQATGPRAAHSGSKPGSSNRWRPSASSRRGGAGGAKPKSNKLELEHPFHDEAYITQTYQSPTPLPAKHQATPKGSLANFCANAPNASPPEYRSVNGIFNKGSSRTVIWRTTVSLPWLSPPVEAVGDGQDKKESERLAALGAILQLHNMDLLDNVKKLRGPTTAAQADIQLSDGTKINYERARQFMDYYCRKFHFGKPEVICSEIRAQGQNGGSWEAVMTINQSRIGVGLAASKKMAQVQCYLDVCQYLEKCDPALWKEFVEAAKTGADLGLAPSVRLAMSMRLDDNIQDVCGDIRTSSIYRNRPARCATNKPSAPPHLDIPTGPRSDQSNAGLEAKSKTLQELRTAYLNDPKTEAIRKARATLPVYARADEVLEHIRNNEVTICMAATGSGKTTQIPQVILDDYIQQGRGAECNIFCTQPRRLAAISVAHRVAKERNEVLGGSIGYQVRFEHKLPQPNGSVTFCTTGIFLKRLQSALSPGDLRARQEMDKVTHVIVDEVHERDVDTDLLLTVLKRLMQDRKARNKPLKIVLMSATVDPTLFQSYFPDALGRPADVIDLPGRAFPVEKNFMDDYIPQLLSSPSKWIFGQEPVAKYIHQQLGPTTASQLGIRLAKPLSDSDEDVEIPYELVAATVGHALKSSDDGHVLVFLPGWEEIVSTQKALERPLGHLPVDINDKSKYSVHVLHSSIPLAEQQAIFEPPPPGIRRVILSTNIAETSVTIPDVVYVVDTAKIKENRYEPERHMSSLVSAWVGSSNLNQRAGRAGRHRPGTYYGLLSKNKYATLHPHQTVEMKRTDLSNVVMHVKALDFPGMTVEEVLAATIEPPEPERVSAALSALRMVGAIDSEQHLTQLGRVLLALPIDAQMGRMVLYGSFFRCVDQAVALAAILSNREPFVSPMHVRREAEAIKNSWAPEGFRSDALATLRAFNAWWDLQSRGKFVAANQFCFDNFLAKPTLLLIQKTKQHLLESLDRAGVLEVSAGGQGGAPGRVGGAPELNVNGECWPLLAGMVAVACQPKFAIRTGEMTLRTAMDRTTFIHPASVNNRKKEMKLSTGPPPEQKQIYAYMEKRRNTTTGGGSPQTYLTTTTRLDPLVYLLFGAYEIDVVERGLECDKWLPIVGDLDTLDNIQRLKTYMEGCFLRIYEGIVAGRRRGRRQNIPIAPREEQESEDEWEETDLRSDYSLSSQEMKELDRMTQDVVNILSRYSDERMESQSQNNSRPVTPMATPRRFAARLPGGMQSGYSTPFHSRPSTPSALGNWR